MRDKSYLPRIEATGNIKKKKEEKMLPSLRFDFLECVIKVCTTNT